MLKRFGLVKTKSKSVSVGDEFERLTVIAVGQIPGTYRYTAVCQCVCGSKPKAIRMESLKSGITVSCGCIQKERTTTHGLSKSPHYGRWRHMMDRCYNKSAVAYPDYGGRGIKVCPEWHDLETYIAQLPDGFFKGAELDRYPDNDGDYEPGNVRWVTSKLNANNRRSSKMLAHDGRTLPLREWSKITGINEGTLWERIEVWSWPVDRALTTPPMTAKERMAKAHETRWAGHKKKPAPPTRVLKTVEFKGRQVTIAELAKVTKISVTLLRKRIFERGWPIDKAVAK
jgi:hypothetical protein